jgi:hypothetical protein
MWTIQISFQNSIRHNLSLHSRFMRVQNEGTGKSSWWMLNNEVPGPGGSGSGISPSGAGSGGAKAHGKSHHHQERNESALFFVGQTFKEPAGLRKHITSRVHVLATLFSHGHESYCALQLDLYIWRGNATWLLIGR